MLGAALTLGADSRVVQRFPLPGDPRGIAVGADGMIYVGLAQPQAVVAIDPDSGAVRRRVVLDSAEIASTKELVTLRTNSVATRLFVANGSDESATILSLPDLAVLREITIEGEAIRDALPDPKGRYLYLLGRRVHVFDISGNKELRTLPVDDPTAIAASATTLAVFNRDGVRRYDTATFKESAPQLLRIDAQSAVFAGDTLIALARDAFVEVSRTGVVRDAICLPDSSGPQIATLASPSLILLAERRCNSSAFSAVSRKVTPASLYGIDAYALAYSAKKQAVFVTEKSGFVSVYRVPRVAVVH